MRWRASGCGGLCSLRGGCVQITGGCVSFLEYYLLLGGERLSCCPVNEGAVAREMPGDPCATGGRFRHHHWWSQGRKSGERER